MNQICSWTSCHVLDHDTFQNVFAKCMSHFHPIYFHVLHHDTIAYQNVCSKLMHATFFFFWMNNACHVSILFIRSHEVLPHHVKLFISLLAAKILYIKGLGWASRSIHQQRTMIIECESTNCLSHQKKQKQKQKTNCLECVAFGNQTWQVRDAFQVPCLSR